MLKSKFPALIQFFVVLVCCASASSAENATPLLTASINATPLLTAPIIESQRVILDGNTPPAARDARNDRGVVADTLHLDHLFLVLKGSAQSETALKKLIDDLHDPGATAEYHRWLTPRQLGASFGLGTQDLEVIQGWLKSHGFSINRVFTNGLVIDFSGSAAQVREAFHTEIHQLVLANGEHHISNMSDPEIPAALAPAIQGVASLHDFFPEVALDSPGAGEL